MSRQNMLRSTILLTVSGILAKSVDFIFRAFYSRQLGSEGMGIFSLCLSVHGIMLTIASGGIGLAVSKTVSECYSRGRLGEAKNTMHASLATVLGLSLAAISFVFLFSNKIATDLLKEPRCRMSLVFISPSVLFMGISYCIKGYFYASRKILIPASSEFLEQAVKLLGITFFLSKMLPRGVEFGCMAVFLGISLGEFSSCIYLIFFYFLKTRFLKPLKTSSSRTMLSLFKVSFPIMLTSLLGSFLRMQEDILVVSSLKKSGLVHSEALSVYGGIHGMAMPLIVFPLSLLSSCFTLLVPEISRAYALKNQLRLKTLVSKIYRFCTLFGFFVFCVFTVFGERLSLLIYHSAEISRPLRLISVISPMIFLDSVSTGILNGMGKQQRLFLFSILDSVSRLVLIYFLMPKLGIGALIFVIIFSNAFTLSLTYQSVINFSKIGLQSAGRLWRHILAVVFTSVLSLVFFRGFSSSLQTVFEILIMAIIYFIFSILFGAAKKDDFKWLFRRMFF